MGRRVTPTSPDPLWSFSSFFLCFALYYIRSIRPLCFSLPLRVVAPPSLPSPLFLLEMRLLCHSRLMFNAAALIMKQSSLGRPGMVASRSKRNRMSNELARLGFLLVPTLQRNGTQHFCTPNHFRAVLSFVSVSWLSATTNKR